MNMKKLIISKDGQWIVLSGFAVSIALIILTVFLNQAVMVGQQASQPVLEFPKQEIRELMAETRQEVVSAAIKANISSSNFTEVKRNMTPILDNYTRQVSQLFLSHGQFVNISLYNNQSTNTSTHVWVNVTFTDGTTYYRSAPEIVEVIK